MDFIEGVGNEVVISGVITAGVVISSVIFLFRHIHEYYVNESSGETIQVGQQNSSERNENMSYHRRTRDDSNCPVCLEEAKFGIETNCSHIFCAQCILTYWHERNWVGPVNCPVCRQQVTVLFPAFSEDEVSSAENIEEKSKVVVEINAYNRRFSGEPRPWMNYIQDLPTMLRHLWREFFSIGGLVYMFRVRVILCLVIGFMYLISPLDVIPEAIFGFLGLIDDMFVFFLIMIYLSIMYRRFLANRDGTFQS